MFLLWGSLETASTLNTAYVVKTSDLGFLFLQDWINLCDWDLQHFGWKFHSHGRT